MNLDFKLRSGKFAGKTLEWLQNNESSYLSWVKENRPEMLKGADKPTPVAPISQKSVIVKSNKTMSPNDNFFNEGPHEISKPYLKKMEELGNQDLVI